MTELKCRSAGFKTSFLTPAILALLESIYGPITRKGRGLVAGFYTGHFSVSPALTAALIFSPTPLYLRRLQSTESGVWTTTLGAIFELLFFE